MSEKINLPELARTIMVLVLGMIAIWYLDIRYKILGATAIIVNLCND